MAELVLNGWRRRISLCNGRRSERGPFRYGHPRRQRERTKEALSQDLLGVCCTG